MDTALQAFGRMIFPDGYIYTNWDLIKTWYNPKLFIEPTISIKNKLQLFSLAYGIPALSIWATYRASKAVYQSEKAISWRENFGTGIIKILNKYQNIYILIDTIYIKRSMQINDF